MRTRLWLALAALTLGAVAVVGVPVWIIQPFAAQTARGLAWSHTIKQIAPLFTAAALVAGALLAATLWRVPIVEQRARWRVAASRAVLVLALGVVAGTAWFSRQNHFEWMFRPNLDPGFVSVSDALDVDADEPVIGVVIGSDALAFPITRIGYHHLVNTTLGRKPIVGTY